MQKLFSFLKNTSQSVLAAALVLGFGVVTTALAATWAPPTALPPGENAEAPLTVSTVGQIKAGGLGLNTSSAATGLFVYGGAVFFPGATVGNATNAFTTLNANDGYNHIRGATAFDANAYIYNAVVGDMGFGANWAGFAHQSRATTLGYSFLSSNDGLYTVMNARNLPNAQLLFRFDNADKMSLDRSGNLVTSGSHTLNGNLYFSNLPEVNGSRNNFMPDSNASGWLYAPNQIISSVWATQQICLGPSPSQVCISSWPAVGAQGPKGDKGDTGATGASGTTNYTNYTNYTTASGNSTLIVYCTSGDIATGGGFTATAGNMRSSAPVSATPGTFNAPLIGWTCDANSGQWGCYVMCLHKV